MDFSFLTKTILFRGTTEKEAEEMLHCLQAFTKDYQKGEIVYRIGEQVDHLGLVLSGNVHIENDDIWGNRNILSHVQTGQIFAETYACIPGEPLMVNVIAAEKSQVLFLNMKRLLSTCTNSCEHHSRLIHNLLQVTAQKNLTLSRKIFHTASKSIRGRLLSYLSEQAVQSGSKQFVIPFNRQQLADYLNVERSALSNELSKMKADGLLDYERNSFVLYTSFIEEDYDATT